MDIVAAKLAQKDTNISNWVILSVTFANHNYWQQIYSNNEQDEQKTSDRVS